MPSSLKFHRWLVSLPLFGVSIALALVVWLPPDPVRAAPWVTITIDGHSVDLNASEHAEARRIAEAFLRRPLRLNVPGTQPVESNRGDLGATIDIDHLATLLADAKNPRSPLRLHFAALHHEASKAGAQTLDLPLPLSIDSRATRDLLLDLKDDLDGPAIDARMNTTTREVIPEHIGRRLDVWATLDRIAVAIRSQQAEANVIIETVTPRRTAESLNAIRMDTVLGHFETRYNESQHAADRTHNLRVGGAYIDGYVVSPGEHFDFNALLGERTQAKGFRAAPVIAGGEVTNGIGGGSCQVSGTLHGAVFFAGLPILDRHPHSRPSSYIKLGLDAAVAYPNLNLQFRNDRDTPIVLSFKVEDGWVRAQVLGTGPRRMVSFVRRIDAFRTYPEREEPDGDLPTGVRVLSQRGVPGFTVQRWRIVRDVELNQAIRYDSQDHYPPTTQIWRVGTGAPAPEGYEPPPGDHHPEYRADHYLSMTEGPGIDGILEQRRAGLTGRPGWTVDEGMPSADP